MPMLTWGLLSLSLIIISLLIWLGITVLLTAERRNIFVWLVGIAMLFGAIFVSSHAVLITHGTSLANILTLSQWPLVWVAGIFQPCAWYFAILWHVGFWEHRKAMRHRHLHSLASSGFLVVFGISVILVATDPVIRAYPNALFSSYDPATILAGPNLGSIPVFAIVYLLLIITSIVLTLDALYHPTPSRRLMGHQARERARPWLVASTFGLLAISLLVCTVLLRFMPEMLFVATKGISAKTAHSMIWIDLAIAILLAVFTILIGQAMVSYEIFTGKVLLRQGLQRRWWGAVSLSVGFSMLLSAGIVIHLSPIYCVLAVLVLVAASYAISTWRSFTEHEHTLNNLRLLSTGPQIYTNVISGEWTEDRDTTAFANLCEHVLGVELAYLWPLGSLSSLLHPLVFPLGTSSPEQLPALATHVSSPKTLCVPLDPVQYGGAILAIPLWSERGLNGMLLLGQRKDHGLFAQEDIEMARAVAERMLDSLASAELTRRLLQLQRSRMAETQVLDQRTRRALHDEVLPQVHTLMLSLSANQLETTQVMTQLTEIHRQIANILHAMPTASVTTLSHKGVIAALQQFIEQDCQGAFEAVNWEIAPTVAERFASLSPSANEVLYGAAREAIRNAARHARGNSPDRPIRLHISASFCDILRISIEDDGVGVGASSPSRAGAGHGIALHSTMMAVIGGSWEVESQPGVFTRVTLTA